MSRPPSASYSRPPSARPPAPAPGSRWLLWPPLACSDCGADTVALGEYYMVRPGLWRRAVRAAAPRRCWRVRFLCVGCLEARLGRRLTGRDFTSARCNARHAGPRLADRLQSLELVGACTARAAEARALAAPLRSDLALGVEAHVAVEAQLVEDEAGVGTADKALAAPPAPARSESYPPRCLGSFPGPAGGSGASPPTDKGKISNFWRF